MRKLQNWLLKYEEYLSQTESPKNYKTWAAISVLGSALKRNCWMTYSLYKIFPSQYIVLVGPPSVGKGTAIIPAVDIAKEAGVINYISDRITSEKLIEKLATGFGGGVKTAQGQIVYVHNSSATIVSPELPIFLQASEWMLPLMCDLWDEKGFSYDTKTKGTYDVKDSSVGLIAGCVPDYIRKLNKDSTSAITGGFTSRCIFVYETEQSQRIAWPSNNGHLGLVKQDLIDDLREIDKLRGEFKFTEKAKLLFSKWYNDIKIDQFESEVLTGFKGRMRSHVFKTCMALSVSENDNLTIDEANMFNAIQLIEGIKNKVDVTFRSVGESPLAAAQERIRMYIEKHPLVTRPQIMKSNYRHVTDEALTQILFILEAAGVITTSNTGGKIVYTVPRGVSLGQKP